MSHEIKNKVPVRIPTGPSFLISANIIPMDIMVESQGNISSYTLYLSFVLQAFSVIAMFNVMKFSIAILPFSVKAMAEANVSLRRMKV